MSSPVKENLGCKATHKLHSSHPGYTVHEPTEHALEWGESRMVSTEWAVLDPDY